MAKSEKEIIEKDTTEAKTPKKEKKSVFSKKDKSKEKLDKLQEELNESNDKFLRLYAEFDNFRKRTQKEKLDLIISASKDMVKELLPVLDDFERAFANENDSVEVEGKRLIYNKLKGILMAKGLKEIEALDQDFDVELHEALTQIPMEGKKGKVVDVIEKGYTLNEGVIRYSKVVIGA